MISWPLWAFLQNPKILYKKKTFFCLISMAKKIYWCYGRTATIDCFWENCDNILQNTGECGEYFCHLLFECKILSFFENKDEFGFYFRAQSICIWNLLQLKQLVFYRSSFIFWIVMGCCSFWSEGFRNIPLCKKGPIIVTKAYKIVEVGGISHFLFKCKILDFIADI